MTKESKRPARPTPDDLRFAARWLDTYEPVGNDADDREEMGPIRRVSAWLTTQADRMEDQQLGRDVRAVAKEIGLSGEQASSLRHRMTTGQLTEKPSK